MPLFFHREEGSGFFLALGLAFSGLRYRSPRANETPQHCLFIVGLLLVRERSFFLPAMVVTRCRFFRPGHPRSYLLRCFCL